MAANPTTGAHPGSAGNPRPVTAAPILLPPHISGADAVQRIVLACLRHVDDNEPAILAGIDEGVHQARVGLRRLRSALALFEDYLGARAAGGFTDGLRDFGRTLGAARDWDVFLLETLPGYTRERPERAAASLRDSATRFAEQEHLQVRRIVGGGAHRILLADMTRWIAGDSWSAGLGLHALRRLGEPCRGLVPPLLDRMADKAAKRGRHVRRQTPEQRHALRKSMKRLRYSAEFFAGIFPAESVRRYLRNVKRVQDILGALNDSAVTNRLLDALGEAGADAIALAAIRHWAGSGVPSRVHELAKAWRRLEGTEPFWR